MTAFFRWYAAVQALGLLALPLAFQALGRLPDRGYFFAKALGVLLYGLLLWLGASFGLLRNEAGGAVLAAVALACLSLPFARDAFDPRPGRASPFQWLRSHASLVVLGELLFLAFFAGWAFVRAHDPAADHTERPMDLMLLSGIHVSPDFPPRDPWLAGYPIGYYYFGYWMLNALGLLSGQGPELAFNLGQACWLGLLVSGCFGLGFNLVALDRPGSRKTALAAGLLAATSVALAGNPQGALDTLQRAGLGLQALAHGRAAYNFSPPGEDWWWWRASRVLEDRDAAGQHVEVIDEFPAFSFVVGDAHPHLLALPFATLALGLGLNLYLAAREGRIAGRVDRAAAVLVVLALGALPALNAWDFPTQWTISVLAVGLALRFGSAAAGLPGVLARAAGWGAVLAAGALLVSLPYLLTAQSQVEGLRFNREHRTPLFQLLLMLGPLLAGAGLLLLHAARKVLTPWRRLATGAGLFSGAVGLCLAATAGRATPGDPPFTALFLAALLGATLAVLFARGGDTGVGLRFVLLLAAVGLLLLLVPELVYVRDGFGTRMNTVFKLYHQSWLLLGVAAACAIAGSWTAGRGLRWLGGGTLLLVLSGLPYTAAAVHTVTAGFRSRTPTLDALAYVGDAAPDESAAMAWVLRQTPPRAVVLQARGRSYEPEGSRLSAGTGRATLLGWEGHERQWRGKAFESMAGGRAEAIETVYRLAGAEKLAFTLETWGIDYVFVGPVERRVYGVDAAREELFERVMERVFAQGNVRIYRRRDG